MSKFSFNLDNVENVISKKSYKLSDVQDQIVKIGFDVVKFRDAPDDELWQIQSSDDGDYIIALYDEDEKVATASIQPWSVIVKGDNLHIFYKKEHFCKLASAQLGLQETDLSLVKQYLPRKLVSNKNLVKALFNSVDSDTQKNILAKYPELA